MDSKSYINFQWEYYLKNVKLSIYPYRQHCDFCDRCVQCYYNDNIIFTNGNSCHNYQYHIQYVKNHMKQ